jgi:hypothetical protein
MSDREEIEKAVAKVWNPDAVTVRYNAEMQIQCMIVKSVLILDKTVEKLDATSGRLATMNIVLTVGIGVLAAVQLIVAIMALKK